MLFLEVVPRAQLRETVAVGARWYRGAGGAMSIVPDPAADRVRVLEPGKGERVLPVARRPGDAIAGKLISRSAGPVAKTEWLAAKPRTAALFPFKYPAVFNDETLSKIKETAWKNVKWKSVPTTGFDVECSVSIPRQAGSGKVLLLVEFPGREQRPSRCSAWVDGRPVGLEQRNSAEHIGYYNWTGKLRPFESEWCWYLCDVGCGTQRVKFQGAAGHPAPRLGLWVWADQDLADRMQPASVPCGDPAMPQYRDRLDRQGICLLPPASD
jgi:hypothetical protein